MGRDVLGLLHSRVSEPPRLSPRSKGSFVLKVLFSEPRRIKLWWHAWVDNTRTKDIR